MKRVLFFLILSMLAAPAMAVTDDCKKIANYESAKTTIIFLNGILNTPGDAKASVDGICRTLYKYGLSDVQVDYIYNPTGALYDLKELKMQAINSSDSWMSVYELDAPKEVSASGWSNEQKYYYILGVKYLNGSGYFVEDNGKPLSANVRPIVLSALEKIVRLTITNKQDVVIVAHSQGNFIAEAIYSIFYAIAKGATPYYLGYKSSDFEEALNHLRIVNVAPVSSTSQNKRYILGFQDLAVNSMLMSIQKSSVRKYFRPLDSNTLFCSYVNGNCVAFPVAGASDYSNYDALISVVRGKTGGHAFDIFYNSSIFYDKGNGIPTDKLIANLVSDSIDDMKRIRDFNDDFNGTTLDSSKWSSLPCRSAGDPTFPGNGQVHFGSCQSATTQGKVTFNGKKIVIEARFAGPKASGRDTAVALVNSATGDFFQFGDTDYESRGMYAYLYYGGKYESIYPYGGTTTAFKEYRVTIEGKNVTIQRGDSLSNLTETRTEALPYSATDGTYYLRIGTGADWYAPADFDWIRVNTY